AREEVVRRLRRCTRAVRVERHHRVHAVAIEPVDAIEIEVEQLACRDLLRPEQTRELDCRRRRVHGSTIPFRMPASSTGRLTMHMWPASMSTTAQFPTLST